MRRTIFRTEKSYNHGPAPRAPHTSGSPRGTRWTDGRQSDERGACQGRAAGSLSWPSPAARPWLFDQPSSRAASPPEGWTDQSGCAFGRAATHAIVSIDCVFDGRSKFPGKPMTMAVGLLALVASSVVASEWPAVTPLAKQFRFADGQWAKVDVPIVGRRGAVLYRLLCPTWLSAEDSDEDFDYSGDFECRLVAAQASHWRAGWNLLADEEEPTRDWQHRARFLWQEFVGECLTYPGHGPQRIFQLRGMKVTLSISDLGLDVPAPGAPPSKPGFRSFVFTVGVDVDTSASGAFAAATGHALPCCLPVVGRQCDALDCARPKTRGSLCPQAQAR